MSFQFDMHSPTTSFHRKLTNYTYNFVSPPPSCQVPSEDNPGTPQIQEQNSRKNINQKCKTKPSSKDYYDLKVHMFTWDLKPEEQGEEILKT